MAYSTERRAAVLKKLEPPNAVPLRQLAKDEGISEATLHAWRRDARSKGRLLPDADDGPEGWTSRDKFAAVIETAALNETDLAAYCRQRGLYAEQIQGWRTACEQANGWERASTQRLGQATKEEKKVTAQEPQRRLGQSEAGNQVLGIAGQGLEQVPALLPRS